MHDPIMEGLAEGEGNPGENVSHEPEPQAPTDTAILLRRFEQLLVENAILRLALQQAKEDKAQAEHERDGAFEREDKMLARSMALSIERRMGASISVIEFAFDEKMLRLSRNWRDVFDTAFDNFVTKVGAHLERTKVQHPAPTRPGGH